VPARNHLALPEPVEDPFEDLRRLVLALPPDELAAFAARLDPEDLSLLEAAAESVTAAGWRSHPAEMAGFLDPTFRRPRHVDHLSRKFREAADGTSRRQIWNLPGRYGKSTIVQWGGTWLFDRTEGRARLIFVSYGQTLANENADGVRSRLRQYAGVLRTQLRQDRQAINRFVTDAGGGLLAAGINASITGFGANAEGGIIIDDPFKNWQEAHSENKREHVWNQYRGTIRNRLDEEAGFIIVVHHRVHEDDLTAKLLAEMGKDEYGDDWDLVSLPAIAVEGDPLGRAPGEALDPEIRPIEDVRRRAAGLGSYLASSLEQQDPSPEEGTDIKRAWFRIEDALPPSFDDACTSWDLKLKDKEAGDYVVGQAWWRVAGGYWLVDQVRGQYDHATTQNAIALLAVRRPEIKTHVIEYAGSADEVIPEIRRKRPGYEVSDEVATRLGMTEAERSAVQELRRRGMSGIVPKKVGGEGSKRVRARNFIVPNAEAGDIYLQEHAPYLAALLDELAAFPNGAHDDQVDTMSQAIGRLSTGQASATVPTGSVPKPSPARAAGRARIARGPAVAGNRRRRT
jgi:predicted phage terminase large subunit-like protein